MALDARITRRRFLKGLAAAGLATAAGASAYAGLVEPFDYELTETEIFIRDLPRGFEGFRIAQLTDLHHGRLVPVGEVWRVVELARRARPDMYALTGDYTTALTHFVEPCAEALASLEAPAGVWAVLGNHDHRTDGPRTAGALTARGVGVLTNASTTLRRGGDELQLIGVDDWGWGKADFKSALGGVNLARPTILLSHEPRVLDMHETRGLSLIISGHTHGGQICLPLVGSPARFHPEFRYLRGLYERAGTQLYVSRGTGMIGLPFRLGARPEIAVLTLRRQ